MVVSDFYHLNLVDPIFAAAAAMDLQIFTFFKTPHGCILVLLLLIVLELAAIFIIILFSLTTTLLLVDF